ncbi:Potassium voltage-gated channel protein Shal OS=Drosophila melanogaster GN=Shal PE=1 SV=2 [Rhizoctonia solani AG-1 IB]|uniref:Potassium voltage-gated channel protein Shal n=1 Tax=Thanatephorus cucumeris (strain AG1-IB / isolate 7/3/14) TaxID=1108050 RepID=A0A0B7FHC9_THACB|nr:Potassium voltage-gated channel protein Shal OS=Drosophila melanogaster GN=Shal PE=1 SV=2 [Rhizoctonia solani AG-1 IB]
MTESEAGPSTSIAIPLREMGGSPSNNTVSEHFVVEQERRTRRRRHPSGEIHVRPEDLDTNATRIQIVRREMYLLMEQPNSSTAAFVIHFFSTFLIAFSACITTLETLPAFRSSSERVWFGIETALVALFTLEYGARCFAHSETWSQLWNWATSFFPMLDLIAILPFYLLLILKFDMTAIFRFSILRVFRLLRVFRPFRYSNTILLTIEVMFLAVKRSRDALFALGFFVMTTLVVFSTLIYFAERGTWDTTLETLSTRMVTLLSSTQFRPRPGLCSLLLLLWATETLYPGPSWAACYQFLCYYLASCLSLSQALSWVESLRLSGNIWVEMCFRVTMRQWLKQGDT